jgi:hypothetical protein
MRRATLAVIAITAATVVVTSCSSTAPAKTAAPTPTSAADQFTAWFNGGGKQRITDLSADIQALKVATTPAAKGPICQSITGHIAAALAYGPIPDTEAQLHWGKSLESLRTSATDCVGAVGQTDGVRSVEAQIELEDAQREVRAVQDRLYALAAAAG